MGWFTNNDKDDQRDEQQEKNFFKSFSSMTSSSRSCKQDPEDQEYLICTTKVTKNENGKKTVEENTERVKVSDNFGGNMSKYHSFGFDIPPMIGKQSNQDNQSNNVNRFFNENNAQEMTDEIKNEIQNISSEFQNEIPKIRQFFDPFSFFFGPSNIKITFDQLDHPQFTQMSQEQQQQNQQQFFGNQNSEWNTHQQQQYQQSNQQQQQQYNYPDYKSQSEKNNNIQSL